MRSITIPTLACCFLALTVSTAFAETRGDCLEAVKSQQEQIFRQHVDDETAKAEDTFKGKTESFASLSCLENILNSGSDIFYSVPSLGDLMNKMKSAACNVVDTNYNKATAAIGSGVNASLPIGDVVPGVNLNSIGGGFSLKPGQDSTISQEITDNISRASDYLKGIYK